LEVGGWGLGVGGWGLGEVVVVVVVVVVIVVVGLITAMSRLTNFEGWASQLSFSFTSISSLPIAGLQSLNGREQHSSPSASVLLLSLRGSVRRQHAGERLHGGRRGRPHSDGLPALLHIGLRQESCCASRAW
jgi:hypothetical protein